jgi:KaiC/GvpD/RAD55 family RecA-like ATPase
MQAWNQIEQARYSHAVGDYENSKQHYEKAAKLHDLTSSWSYLTPNYFAWSYMEEAEGLSRKENSQQAKQIFQKAYKQFCNAEECFKQKIGEIKSADEKEMAQRLFEASNLRRSYCETRILLEEAKLLDMEGKYLQSSKDYGRAAQNISEILDKMTVEAERTELKYIALLCRAWEKMANAEETTSSESYLEAAELFGQAREYCFTKKASLWALGNSNFCKGLAAGLQYKTSLDLADHTKAKGYINNASTDYLQAGFKAASEYAKATQRLFDAYVFINQAEGEIDQENRIKQYQLAENLLQLAAGSFLKAKQPEKTTLVQQMLENVREEKELAISFNDVLQAPTIASSTSSFSSPTPTSEFSVGLEQFAHANVQANLITHVKEVKVGESFCLSVEFVNAGREPALLLRVDDFVPSDFVVVKKPEIYRLEESCLNMKGKQLAPLKLVEVKLTLQPSKKGRYQLNPKVHYLDEVGQNKFLQLKTLEIGVEEVILGDRGSTGTQELDSLLLGGIPQEYAAVLTGSPGEERQRIVNNFLEAGIKENEVVFHVSTEAEGLEKLLENPNFVLFLCNPKPKTKVPDLPNVYKLRSKTDLTNLSISFAKAYRNIDPSKKKRICVETVSNVLLDYEAKATCKWTSELITDISSKGFTLLAVMDPEMHPPDQSKAVVNLFDGEINIIQSDDPIDCKKSIVVKKLRNQEYIKNPICLT